MKKIAVLICSHLECTESFKIQLKNLFSADIDFDIFIYTNKKYKKELSIFPHLKAYAFIEDNAEDFREDNLLRQKKVSSNVYQYFNLKKCFKLLDKHIEKHHTKYDGIYRIRPDIYKNQYRMLYKGKYIWTMKADLTSPFWVPDLIEEGVIYAKTDQFYLGTYNTMKKISNLIDYIPTYTGDFDFTYWPLNYEKIAESDMNSVRFDMLCYPNKFISKETLISYTRGQCGDWNIHPVHRDNDKNWIKYIEQKNILKNTIVQNMEELKKYIYLKGDMINTSAGMRGKLFRAEKFFAYYITSICNFTVKELKYIRNGG